MKHLYKIIFLFVLINFNSTLAYSSNKTEKSILIKTVADPSGQITGNATVCLNAAQPVITFEVKDDNKEPYTFTYTLNGGASINVLTTGNNKSVTVTAPTNVAGTFTYVLKGVKDKEDKDVAVSSDDKVTITVYPLPIVDFTFTNNACSGTAVQFTTSSNGNTYTWNFGDSGTSSNKNPTHTFTSSGCGTEVFNVTLTITDSNGCSNSKTYAITIKQQPNVLFIDNNHLPYNPLNTTNQFNNCNSAGANPNYNVSVGASSANSNCISSYSVIWQNGGTPEIFTALPFTHTYTSLGAFNMAITAIGQNGCSTTRNYTIKNESNPAGGLVSPGSTTNLCAPTPNLQFTLSNWALNSPGTKYLIDYGDASPLVNLLQSDLMQNTLYYNSSNPSLSSNYPVPHIYNTSSCPSASITATLKISNSCGTTNSTISPIVILKPPVPNFTNPTNVCVNSCVQFTNTSLPASNENCLESTLYEWNFGDGSSVYSITAAGTPNPPCHTYNSPGNYTITLTTSGYCGIFIKTSTICVEPPLVPTFTLNNNVGCTPQSITATNTTVTTNSCVTSTYVWSATFLPSSCGTTIAPIPNQTTTNASFNFTEAGTYTIRLTANNSCSPSQFITKTVVVTKPPIVTIAPIPTICQLGSSTIINPSATITNCGTQSPPTYEWSFHGGTPATPASLSTANPGTISYSTSGTFIYSLKVTNECGSFTASGSITINPSPTITGTLFSCIGATSQLTGSVTAATTSPWTSSNTAVATVGSTGLVTGVSAGTTTITYTNNLGCKTTGLFTVNPLPTITGNLGICIGSTTLLSGSASAATSNPWMSSNSSVATINSTGLVTSLSVGTTTITYTNTNGCQRTATVTVNPLPTITGTITVCVGSTTSLTGSPTAAASNSWSSSNPSVATVSTTGVVTGVSTSTTIITYTNSNGCQNTVTVTVNPKPVIPAQTASICGGSTFTVTPINGPGTVVPINTTFKWIVATNINVTGQSASSAAGVSSISQTLTNLTNVVQTVAYTVTPTSGDTGNCAGVPFAITVTVNPKPVIANQTIAACSGTAFNVPLINSLPLLILSPSTTYTWTVIPPAGIAGASNQTTGVSAISQTLTNSTNASINVIYTVTASSGTSPNNCTTPFIVTVTVNPIPIISNATATICSNTSFSVTPTNGGGTNSTDIVPIGTTYSWPIPISSPAGAVMGGSAATNVSAPISQTLVSTSSSPATLTYTITPKSGNCSGTTFTIVVTVNPSPSVIFSPVPQTLCSGDSSTLVTLSSASSGATFSWSAVQPFGITGVLTGGTNTIPSQQLFNTTTSPITITYSATAATNGSAVCSGTAYNYTIVVKPKPAITEVFTPITCSGIAFSVSPNTSTLNSIPTGTTYSWGTPTVTGGVTGGVAITGQTTLSGTLNNPTDTFQTAVYTVTPSTNNCPGIPFIVTVTVNPKPVIPAQTASICSGSTFSVTPISGPGTVVPLNTTYTWTVATNTNVTGQSASSVAGVSSITQTLTNLTNVAQTVAYTVTPTSGDAGNCAGVPFAITVTVNPKPVIANQTVAACSGTAFNVPLINSPPLLILPTGTTYTWTVTPPSGISGASNQNTGVSAISQTLTNSTNASINVI